MTKRWYPDLAIPVAEAMESIARQLRDKELPTMKQTMADLEGRANPKIVHQLVSLATKHAYWAGKNIEECWCGKMDLKQETSVINGISIKYLTCSKCDGSYYDAKNFALLKEALQNG